MHSSGLLSASVDALQEESDSFYSSVIPTEHSSQDTDLINICWTQRFIHQWKQVSYPDSKVLLYAQVIDDLCINQDHTVVFYYHYLY